MAHLSALLVVLVAHAAAGTDVSEEPSCLMQKSLKLENQIPTLPPVDEEFTAPSCECLNWKQVYASKQVECGRGFEFTTQRTLFGGLYDKKATKYLKYIGMAMTIRHSDTVLEDFDTLDREQCKGIYEKIDDNLCMRTSFDREPGTWHSSNWCYVSNDCYKADSETFIKVPSANLHAKICNGDDGDKMLGDLQPEELMAFGQKHNLTFPHYLVKAAYPSERQWFFRDAMNKTVIIKAKPDEHFHVNENQWTKLERMMLHENDTSRWNETRHDTAAELKEIVDSGNITVIGVNDEDGEKMLVKGNDMWSLSNSYESFKCVSPNGCK